MLSALRKVLIDSHVAGVTVAALLFSSIGAFYLAADRLVYRVVLFIQLIANHPLSTALRKLESEDPGMLAITLACLLGGAAILLAAWMVSRWVYGVGPLRSLGRYRNKLQRKCRA